MHVCAEQYLNCTNVKFSDILFYADKMYNTMTHKTKLLSYRKNVSLLMFVKTESVLDCYKLYWHNLDWKIKLSWQTKRQDVYRIIGCLYRLKIVRLYWYNFSFIVTDLLNLKSYTISNTLMTR